MVTGIYLVYNSGRVGFIGTGVSVVCNSERVTYMGTEVYFVTQGGSGIWIQEYIFFMTLSDLKIDETENPSEFNKPDESNVSD